MEKDLLFAIITPTHKRPDLLLHAITSVKEQSYIRYIHVIINDSPEADYAHVEQVISEDEKIVYLKNTSNSGKNFSLNRALQTLTEKNFAGYIIFLDDDDWLTSNCLETFKDAATRTTKQPAWIISKRSYDNGNDITKNTLSKKNISYSFDYLLTKRFSGDATHCIESHVALSSEYPTTIKNGEEWLYFCQIEKKAGDFLFLNTTGTQTTGYLGEGVTKNYTHPNITKLFSESKKYKILSPSVITYLLARKTKHLVKSLVQSFR